MNERFGQVLIVLVTGLVLGLGVFLVTRNSEPPASGDSTLPEAGATTTTPGEPGVSTLPGETTTSAPVGTQPPGERPADTVPGFTVGQPWGTTVGLTMFRGNPTRSYFGTGDVSQEPSVQWSYPDSGMCSTSTNLGETTQWCGMGWTGQPAVWERPDGITELIFGAYDSAVHFVDAATGEDLRAEFQTGDLIKGSVTVDPDGYPLVYFGSRDNKYRILGLDEGDPVELWSMDATDVSGTWNDDWDSNGAVVDDILYVGGENSWFFAVELNRGYDADGKVTIDPQILVEMPGYNSELIDTAGGNVSIENSPVVYDQRVYFANSAGRIVGLDVSRVREGEAPIVFDYWAGGDIDASLVVDAEGMLYAAVNVKPDQVGPGYRTQANIDRTREVGQLLKLDPYTDGDPRIWGVDLTAGSEQSGTWSTPAVYQGVVYNNTMQGSLIAVDAVTGEILWSDEVGWHSWSSPAVVEGMLVTATCLGDVRGYSLADPRAPVQSWSVSLGETCLEATPAVWDGVIYIGSRDGYLRALG
ncbi:MAG TPA: PQQ-binding-like beta-propeller repeat protein [Acidimicrobiia bacterium]|nr:PQQ-binding-like beta-propeller repeat protein [Acidimicrobiia bacterium]